LPATGSAPTFPAYDAWLIAWGSTSVLQLHDHGGSFGVVHVVEGELVETYTDRRSRNPLRSRLVAAGDTLEVPSTCIHEVWNTHADPALSVHVYSPPLTTMTFYDHRPEHYLEPLRTARGDLATLEEVGPPRPAG
jgi:predicted metal-dependent enzyme (double-stranded beta helix superfamily)